VDAETGDEVDSADIIKGDYIELDPEELEAVAIESKRTIDIAMSLCPKTRSMNYT
jgi:non-homologous end joining protein Ku